MNFNLENIYSEVFRLEKTEVLTLQKDITKKYQTSQQTFQDVPEEDRADLQHFAFICMLSFDVYVKKQLIEKMIDLKASEPEKQEEQTSTKSSNKQKE